MKSIHYFAARTDSGCLIACPHQHQTVTSAAACVSSAGGYAIAVENGTLRTLSDAEEAEFRHAMYGDVEFKQLDTSDYVLIILVMLAPQGFR